MQLTKEEVDSFTPGTGYPCCQLLAEKMDGELRSLKYEVFLNGAKPPRNYLLIRYKPGT